MLSDREWHELTAIERGLADDDPGFALAFSEGRPAPRGRRRHWPSRLLLVAGVVLLAVGTVTSSGSLFFQGLLAAAAGFAWSRWRAHRWPDEPPAVPGPPSRGMRPRLTPPDWFRPA